MHPMVIKALANEMASERRSEWQKSAIRSVARLPTARGAGPGFRNRAPYASSDGVYVSSRVCDGHFVGSCINTVELMIGRFF